MTRSLSAAAIALVAAGLAGCWHGTDSDSAGEPDRAAGETSFGSALATVGGGTAPIGTGYGWIDVAALRGERTGGERGLDWAARALGPSGSNLVRERRRIRRRTGIDLAGATRLVSSAASYTAAIRADGVDTARLRRRFLRDGRVPRQRGRWELFGFGRVSSVRFDTPVEIFGPFGPRVAVAPDALIAARRGQTRRDLTGAGASPLDDPVAALAVACLGDVVAARIVPNNFTHWPGHGPELLAFGVELADPAPREIFCAVDPDAGKADDAAAELSAALAADAVDEVTGERISDLIAGSEVERIDGDGAAAARAELEPAPGSRPGFVFAAFTRGSAIAYLGLPPLRTLDNVD